MPCRRVPRGLGGGSLVLETAGVSIALALGKETAGDLGLVVLVCLFVLFPGFGGPRAVISVGLFCLP